MTNKQYWVIAYDVTEDRRRQRVSKLLESFGTRSNYSVFECIVTSGQLNKIQSRMKKLIDKKTDCVLYYYLCVSCVEKRAAIGRVPGLVPEVIMA